MTRYGRRGWRLCVRDSVCAGRWDLRHSTAGHDVYHQRRPMTNALPLPGDGLKESVDMASRARATLAMEIMDYPLMNSSVKRAGLCSSPQLRGSSSGPDIGNLSAR